MKGIKWTRQELDFLTDHYGQPGCTYEWMAANKPGEKRTVLAIRNQAHYLGIQDRSNCAWRFAPEVYASVAGMASEGLTEKQIRHRVKARFGVEVSAPWVWQTISKRIPEEARLAWRESINRRRSEAIKASWEGRRASA